MNYVFVLPSALNTEVFPLVFLEAAAAGLPIVCSDVKTFSCFVENEYNGIMSMKGDINSLSEAIVRILSQPEIRQVMSDNTKNKVRSYSWYKIAQQTEDVYKQLLSA
ncbi:MAG: glycosyltransferase [Dehalococcoidia bacterium]